MKKGKPIFPYSFPLKKDVKKDRTPSQKSKTAKTKVQATPVLRLSWLQVWQDAPPSEVEKMIGQRSHVTSLLQACN